MKKISKREIIAFLLGIFTLFLFESIYDWEGTKKAFFKGYEEGRNSIKIDN
jgi:hypothetical protein